MQQKIEQLRQYISSLTDREKVVLLSVSVLVALFILVGGILAPLMTVRAKMADNVITKDEQLRKIYEISARIKGLKQAASASGSTQPAGFTLFGFLEELASRVKVNDRIEYMKPVNDPTGTFKEAVEVKIRSIYQEDLISILYDIENCRYNLRIKHLSVKRVEKDNNIDIVLRVVRYG